MGLLQTEEQPGYRAREPRQRLDLRCSGGSAESRNRQRTTNEGGVDSNEYEGLGKEAGHGQFDSDVIRPLNSSTFPPVPGSAKTMKAESGRTGYDAPVVAAEASGSLLSEMAGVPDT
jgi:hypothetical protein